MSIREITIKDLKKNTTAVLDRVTETGPLYLTKGGKRVLKLVPIVATEVERQATMDEMRAFRQHMIDTGRAVSAEEIRDAIEEGRM